MSQSPVSGEGVFAVEQVRAEAVEMSSSQSPVSGEGVFAELGNWPAYMRSDECLNPL